MKIRTCFVLALALALNGFSQPNPSIYYRNFVYHANGSYCNHTTPTATFTAWLNREHRYILIENAPRWHQGGDPNIDGKGTFGVELGNFPNVTIGDSVFIRFTCNETKQQGLLTDGITAIPWYRFPQILYLASVNLPAPPQNLTLAVVENGHRTLQWHQQPGLSYVVYRRSVQDTVHNGKSRMLYHRLAENLSVNVFVDTTAQENKRYGYIVYAVNSQGIFSSHSPEVNEEPVGADLTIGWIARLPRLNYRWGSAKPKRDGWPAPEQPVIWQANVKNWSGTDVSAIGYDWYLDDVVVQTGTVAIPANSTVTIDFPWTWTFDRHRLTFVIDPLNDFPEEEENNNSLTIVTDAIGVGFYVEQGTYDYFNRYQKDLEVNSNCWEDWAQRHVRRWNHMFAEAIFPDSPHGVLDRIRIDNITVVPDGSLPLAGGLATNHPNMNDRTVDLQWGFPALQINSDFYANHTNVSDNNPFYFEGSLLHELGHARYLIDLYGFNVHEDGSGSTIAITENGQLIAGTDYMPNQGGAVFWMPIKGLMNGQYTYIDSYSAAALNLIAGHRAVQGNYNAPGNIGVFLNDLPQQNRLTVTDDQGTILPNADIRIYRATGQAGVWYGKYYDATPDLQLLTDGNGQVLLGRCPFAADGTLDHTLGISNGVIIIRVQSGAQVGYTFLDATRFNMEYWRGNKEMGNYEVTVHLVDPTVVKPLTDQIPVTFKLCQNYPNPFNPVTTIRYELARPCHVLLEIYNMTGQKLTTLVAGDQPAGIFQVIWDGSTSANTRAANGMYLYRIQAGNFTSIKKMILLK